MLLGCIADDFTGASDLANTLTAGGMRTVQTIGVPDRPVADADAVVIALKSRSIDPAEAVSQSLSALAWLQSQGASQILFKYCSTFDSSPAGNIGPVAQVLLDQLGERLTIACPAFPTNKRTLYMGHLFVGDKPLNESGMQDHPLTPMSDSNLVRWLQRQMPGKVGLLDLAVVRQGAAAVRDRLVQLADDDVRVAVADAITDEDLRTLGEGCADLALITGGSGIALGLPENFRRKGQLSPAVAAPVKVGGRAVVLSGSCSTATRAQVERYKQTAPSRLVTAAEVCEQGLTALDVAKWVVAQPPDPAPLVFTSADPAAVAKAQEKYGAEQVAQAIESFVGELSANLGSQGFRRFIVAGGETSGAVVKALGVRQLAIGPEIDPGVPALRGVDVPLGLALKSGNFGAEDFFDKALRRIT